MNTFRTLALVAAMLVAFATTARPPLNQPGLAHHNPQVAPTLRAGCVQGTAKQDLNINNVRCQLGIGGDVWWDEQLSRARYIVPNVPAGEVEISSIYAGGVWLGAKASGGNLVVAASTFHQSGVDFWPGPLSPDDPSASGSAGPGSTESSSCANWDEHFVVSGADITNLRTNPGGTVSNSLLGWPGRGNVDFATIHGFNLPDQRLAPFFDANGDGVYSPREGEYPYIDVRGCEERNKNNPIYADQMIWWVYNDNGNIHKESSGAPMYMEVQAMAFGYKTTDEFNNMTFYRYKLINKNNVAVDSTYFSLWTDPDLGYPEDDYIGSNNTIVKTDTVYSDTSQSAAPITRQIGRGLGIVYNGDSDDNATAQATAPGYGTPVPALGVDYFRGPLGTEYKIDSVVNGQRYYSAAEIGLTSFMYYVRRDLAPVPAMGDPSTAQQYYNLMKGKWSLGQDLRFGGNGYNTGAVTAFAFDGDPANATEWSMCSANMPNSDYRFLHSSGPFRLEPGAVNELIQGIIWIPNHITSSRCAAFKPLLDVDDLAQSLFDNCFKLVTGPTAPDLDIVELDKQLILILREDEELCARTKECGLTYEAQDPRAPAGTDQTYNFEGYKIFQLSGPNVSDLNDTENARLAFQCDVKNGISRIVNWTYDSDLNTAVPEIKVVGANKGLNNTFNFKKDLFSTTAYTGLVNHRKYYFKVVAYGYNDYITYNPQAPAGGTQLKLYLEGRGATQATVGIPRINTPEYNGVVLNTEAGDGPDVTRYDGYGNSGGTLEVRNYEEVETAALAGTVQPVITYKGGTAPVKITIVNPTRVPNGRFKLTIFDNDPTDGALTETGDVFNNGPGTTIMKWQLQDINDPTRVWSSLYPLKTETDQVILELGIAISAIQKPSIGTDPLDPTGFVSGSYEYRGNNVGAWLYGIPDDIPVGFGSFSKAFNVLRTGTGEDDYDLDPNSVYASKDSLGWYPLRLANCKPTPTSGTVVEDYYLSPNYISQGSTSNCQFIRTPSTPQAGIYNNLRNVNIVFTPDVTKWSRCIVVETANAFYTNNLGIPLDYNRISTTTRATMMDLQNFPSIDPRTRDANGNPVPMNDPNAPVGYSYFPGYAYDVETGERLNIFFGENGLFKPGNPIWTQQTRGKDLIWNPTSQLINGIEALTTNSVPAGYSFTSIAACGQEFIYVMDEAYDGCAAWGPYLSQATNPGIDRRKGQLLRNVMWATMPGIIPGYDLSSGIPPSEVAVKLRVNRPYGVKVGTNDNNGYPHYEFTLDGQSTAVNNTTAATSALDLINVVPNPYYAYSEYESTSSDNIIKITNLPGKCNVSIWSLDGRLVRSYKRDLYSNFPVSNYRIEPIQVDVTNPVDTVEVDEVPYINTLQMENQIVTSIDWDLRNTYSVPVASGVYLIRVEVPGIGERTLKAFIISRNFDAQKL